MASANRSWRSKPLKEVGKVVTGTTPSKSHEEYYGGNIPFVTPGELGFSEPVEGAATYLTELGAKKAKLIPKNSVMVCCIGSLGKIGFAGRELATNQQINSVVFDETQVDPRYGFRFCETLKPMLEHIAPSTTVAIVNKSRFESFEIPLPPLAEQQRIAAILDKADALRTKRRTALAKLDTLLQSTFLDMFGDPVTNPKGWKVKPLSKLANVNRGKFTPRPRNDPKFFGGDYPFIQTGDIARSSTYLTDWSQTLNELGIEVSRAFEVGTVVIAIVGATIGETAILSQKVYCPDSVVGLEPICEESTPEFLEFSLRFWKPMFHARAPQTARANINLNILRPLPFMAPPVKLQLSFTKMAQKTMDLKNLHYRKLQVQNDLFASLQQRAFKGEL